MKPTTDIHSEITNRIIEAIEAGAGTFEMPWHGARNLMMPVNAITNRTYRGINVLSFWVSAQAQGYSHPQWGTFKQWRELGTPVRKGERGTPIVFYKMLEIDGDSSETDGASEDRTIPFARASWVFNAAQVEGFVPEEAPVHTVSRFARIEQAESAIRATGATIAYGGNRAFYHRIEDRIQVPSAGDFIGSATSSAREAFYSTIFHEIAHWSGAECRLNRAKGKRFADRVYAFEEIIAELSAAFTCARLGITTSPRADHAAYIADHLTILKDDNTYCRL